MNVLSLVGNTLANPKLLRSYDPVRGWSTKIEYTGTEGRVTAIVPLLVRNKLAFELDTMGPLARLTITTPDSGDPNSDSTKDARITYDLQSNISQKSLWEHWRTIRFAYANFNDIRAIKTGLQKNEPVSGLSGDALTFYNMILSGQDSFNVSQSVFRVTVIAAVDAELQALQANSNAIYTTQQMINETNPPISPYVNAINAAATSLFDDFYDSIVPANCTFGWLKQAPSINTIAGQKSATVVEFWLEAWSNYSYGAVEQIGI